MVRLRPTVGPLATICRGPCTEISWMKEAEMRPSQKRPGGTQVCGGAMRQLQAEALQSFPRG